MIALQKIHQRLAEELKQSGLSQTEIGTRIGVSQQTISHYLKGDKMPALDTFANLCAALDADPAYILGLTD